MKRLSVSVLLAGFACLSPASLQAQNTATATFGYSGSITSWWVPVAGDYSIVAYGAQGGLGGGYGAVMGGNFQLDSAQWLTLLVGGEGIYGGGGGGTFVVNAANNPLVVAGGGGGGATNGFVHTSNGINASLSTAGNAGSYFGGPGGISGGGGGVYTGRGGFGASGGGGFFSDGTTHNNAGSGGASYLNGGAGGSGGNGTGGFGGGGGIYIPTDSVAGGGGGGYSGGGGGGGDTSSALTDVGTGGGGGSYLDSSASNVVMYVNSSTNANYTPNGQVVFSLVTSDLLIGNSFNNPGKNVTFTSGSHAEANVLVGTGPVGGVPSFSNNSLTVANAGTTLTASGNVVVGLTNYSNSMVISNGASVTLTTATSSAGEVTGGVLGYEAVSAGNTLLVTGTGSTWNNEGGAPRRLARDSGGR